MLNKSEETITQTNKRLQEIEEQATLLLDKETMDITTKRKHARDERRKNGAELKILSRGTHESPGAVGGKSTTDGSSTSRGINFKDTPDSVSRLVDDYCNVSLERIYPGQGEKIKRKIQESELNKTLNTNPFNLRPEDLTDIVNEQSSRPRNHRKVGNDKRSLGPDPVRLDMTGSVNQRNEVMIVPKVHLGGAEQCRTLQEEDKPQGGIETAIAAKALLIDDLQEVMNPHSGKLQN